MFKNSASPVVIYTVQTMPSAIQTGRGEGTGRGGGGDGVTLTV
jgi:hypothetical protein